MAIAQDPLPEEEFEAFLLSGNEGLWELHDGVWVETPGMTWDQRAAVVKPALQLRPQSPESAVRLQAENRVRCPATTVLQPDVMVIPELLLLIGLPCGRHPAGGAS